MDAVWEEKLLVFEELRDSLDPYRQPLQVSKEIQLHLSDYVCHSTRAFRFKSNIYLATEVTLRRSSRVSVSDTIPPEVEKVLEGGSSIFLDSSPISRNRPSFISYIIYDNRQLYFENQSGKDQPYILHGEPLLILEDKLFKFKEISFPMTRALYGRSCDISSEKPRNVPWQIGLKAAFKQPSWFRQAEGGRVVVPGMFIPDFLSLQVSVGCSLGSDWKSINIEVTNVTVELHELVWHTASDSKTIKLRPSSWYRRKKQLQNRECRKPITQMSRSVSEAELLYEVSPLLYNCRLPETGPTFFDQQISRAYAIMVLITMEWDGGHQKVTLATFSEISVAQRDYHFLRRSIPLELPLQSRSPSSIHSLTSTERIPRSTFRPDAFELSEIQNLPNVEYRSHQMDAFAVGGDIVTVTVVDVAEFFQPDSYDVCEKYEVSKFGIEGDFGKEKLFVICEVVKSSEVEGETTSIELVAGPFLGIDGRRVRCSFPFRSPLYFPLVGYDKREDRMPVLTNSWNWQMDLSFACEFIPHTCFKQSHGDNIVLPGMRLADFLRLEFRFPASYSELFEAEDFKLMYTELSIVIKQRVGRVDGSLWKVSESKILLRFRRCRRSFYWGWFERVPGSSHVSTVIPTDLYDCTIPQLGPTFFSSEIYRTYSILAELELWVDGWEQSRTSIVEQKIMIGTKDIYSFADLSVLPLHEQELLGSPTSDKNRRGKATCVLQ